MTARLSVRAAINAKCKECIYDPLSRGTWREQVANCSSSTCPLHPLRPGPINAKKDAANGQDGISGDDEPECGSPAEDLAFVGQSQDIR